MPSLVLGGESIRVSDPPGLAAGPIHSCTLLISEVYLPPLAVLPSDRVYVSKTPEWDDFGLWDHCGVVK